MLKSLDEPLLSQTTSPRSETKVKSELDQPFCAKLFICLNLATALSSSG